LRQPIADQDADNLCFFIREKVLLQQRASVLQHQSTALRAAWPRPAAGWAGGGASGCPGLWCRAGSLLCPRGCVPGQGLCHLPGELPRALQGELWGEGAHRQGRGLLLPQLLPGTGGSQLHCITECFQMHTVKEETRQGRSFSCSQGREKDWRQKTKGAVNCEHISETFNFFFNQLFVLCTECAFSLSFLKG